VRKVPNRHHRRREDVGYIQESDVTGLLTDGQFLKDLAAAVAVDPAGMDDLAKEVADKLSDALEDDPIVRRQILQAAVASPEFKRRVIQKVLEEMK
jgi:hypothetical protein